VKTFTFAVLTACLVAVAALSRPPTPPVRDKDKGLVLPRQELVHLLAAPWQQFAADFYWLMEINQLGRAGNAQEYRDVCTYAELATDLDPRHYGAYHFGAVGCVYNLGHEQWMNVEPSNQLLQKGIRHFPRDVRLRFLLGYNLGILKHDAKAAAPIFEALSKEPGAPPHLAPLATRLYAESGQFDASTAMARALRDSAQDEEMRAFYDLRLKEIAAEQLLQSVDAAIGRYTARTGGAPPDLQALVAAGDLPALPEDPLGGEIVLGATGRARSTASTFRLRAIHQYLKENGLQP
jgi:hypothetical protein